MASLRADIKGYQPMGKAMSIAGMVVAGLIAFVFAFDLVLKFPFSRANWVMDVGFLISSLVLGYLSWNALRDMR